MGSFILSFFVVLTVIFIVPVVVYGQFVKKTGLAMPEGVSSARFLGSILVSKAGAALAFCGIFYLTQNYFSERWLLYALIWLGMFIFDEVGKAFGPDYSWKEASAGIISECIYFPASAFLLSRLIGA